MAHRSYPTPLGSEVEITVDPDDDVVSFDGQPVEDIAPELVAAVREGLGPRAPWSGTR